MIKKKKKFIIIYVRHLPFDKRPNFHLTNEYGLESKENSFGRELYTLVDNKLLRFSRYLNKHYRAVTRRTP